MRECRLRSHDVATAWRLIRLEVAREAFPGLIVVPHLFEADFYDLMVCFTKCPSSNLRNKIAGARAKVEASYRLHGHIADLLVPSKTNMEELLQMCTFPKREEMSKSTFAKKWVEGMGSVTLKLIGLTKLVTSWTTKEGGIVVDTKRFPWLQNAKKLYIVSEVVFAKTVSIEVINNEWREARQLRDIPVAFSYFKFPLTKKGVLRRRQENPVDTEADFSLVGASPGSLY